MLVPPGIQNSGNTCFASSILHCLFNQQLFRSAFHEIMSSHVSVCKESKQGLS